MLFKTLLDSNFIKVNKLLVHALGYEAAAIYSELLNRFNMYKNDYKLDEEGYFFFINDSITLNTGIGYKQVIKAIKILTDHKLIFKKRKGLPAKNHYKINYDEKLLEKILMLGENKQDELYKKLNGKRDIEVSRAKKNRNSSSTAKMDVLHSTAKTDVLSTAESDVLSTADLDRNINITKNIKDKYNNAAEIMQDKKLSPEEKIRLLKFMVIKAKEVTNENNSNSKSKGRLCQDHHNSQSIHSTVKTRKEDPGY